MPLPDGLFDVTSTILVLVAVLYSWRILVHIKNGELRRIKIWSALAITAIGVYKFLETAGEFMMRPPYLHELEETMFFVGILFLMYAAKLTFDFFSGLSYKLKRFEK
ncbi:hypothetical protein HY489_00430 [Candidatus Woesearchaeota archaeon]|nr:hypothetical protein [Candidatus Woesearchaeota archaeon]